jgi:pimeloyl-ACP methyl ester carboxylesterase
MAASDESVVLLPGPWTHRDIAARSARFHAAEAGDGPLVLLLHGFAQFWWTWRHQLAALAEAGYRAVAPDLRGYGASDKPPRGYDAPTLADDVAGMIRALGEHHAVVVGHDWGATVGWTVAAAHPELVRGLVIVGSAHPLRWRQAPLQLERGQLTRTGHLAAFQLPWLPERWLTRRDGRAVARLLTAWAAPGWPDEETAQRYREAILIPGVAHSSLEYFRWMARSQLRPDGARYAQLLGRGATVPTLQVHGELDGCVLPATAAGSQRFVHGRYDWTLLEGVGHFPQEEAPAAFTRVLLRWLAGLARDRDAAGRPRNARPRDRMGRPLPRQAGAEPPADELPLPPAEALDEADRLIDAGLPFRAHEVLEAVWKTSPTAERDLWRGLAQLAVGLTHAQRGNNSGAARLLRRGADRITPYAESHPHQLAVDRLAAQARGLADRIEHDERPGDLSLRLRV